MSKAAPGVRYAEIERETASTRVRVVLALDGGTRRDVSTGIGFFDHLLQQLALHGQFDLGISAEGDLDIDDHDTVRDVGEVLGLAIREAVSVSDPVQRIASNHTPVDDALMLCVVDLSGRGSYFGDAQFRRDSLGQLSTDSIGLFLKALSHHSGMTLHLRELAGENDHNRAEAMFIGLGRALNAATRLSDRNGLLSAKGVRD